MSYDAVDFMFKKPFKFKYKGMKLTARPMHQGEVITERCLQWLPYNKGTPFNPDGAWLPSMCVGDKTGQHDSRYYIEVLSPFYQGESDNTLTGI